MAYDLYLVETPAGADVEETAEALLVRLQSGLRRGPSPEDEQRVRRVVERLRFEDREFEPAEEPLPGAQLLRHPSGVEVLVDGEFTRFRVPFRHLGDQAVELFEQLFGWLGAAVEATDWRIYDPQDASPVRVSERERERILEIYLSVMDQL